MAQHRGDDSIDLPYRLRAEMKRSGLTLLEVVIASAILAMLTSLLYVTLKSSTDGYTAGSLQAGLNAQSRNLLEDMSWDLADAGVGTLSPAFASGSTTLTFQRNVGYSSGAIAFGSSITYAFAYEPGESDNGLDDNGDGRIDEGRLIRTENGDSVVVSRDLSENGILFTQTGNTVRVQLTLEKPDDRGGVVRYARETTIQVRN